MIRFLPVIFAFAIPLFGDPVSEAKTFFKEQHQDKAFRTFLDALKTPRQAKACAKDEDVYLQALKIYLDPANTPSEVAAEILSKFSKDSEEHPEWHQLGFLIAVAHANQGDFELFFDRFWKSYEHYPNHFLAYKAQAVLHIKLLERAPTPAAHEVERLAIVDFAKKAIEAQPKDHSLYRFILTFTSEQERPKIFVECLNKIINNNTITPRADVKFYVQHAVEFKEFDLAQRFIDKAREWYQVSRVVTAAQEYLDQMKRGKTS